MPEEPDDRWITLGWDMLKRFAQNNRLADDTPNGLTDNRSHRADEGSAGRELFAYIVHGVIMQLEDDIEPKLYFSFGIACENGRREKALKYTLPRVQVTAKHSYNARIAVGTQMYKHTGHSPRTLQIHWK